MKKILSSLIVCVFSIGITFGQSKETDYSDAYNVINQWLEAQVAYEKLPGVSAAVVKDQEVIWSKGFGMASIDQKVKTQTSTIYSICSISKLFTSVAIMQLYDQGKIRLDDPVESVLPNFNIKQHFKDSGPITVRSLLTHSSGLPRESDFPYWTGPDFPFPTQQQMDKRLGEQETLYPASTYFQYSNLGMSLLGEIVEKISGKPYNQYVEENILQPLKLANTHPYLPKEQWGSKMAVGYGAIKRDATRDKVNLFDARGITAAAGYSSNVEDLAQFASWQFRLLEKGGTELLKSSTLKEMHRVQWVDPDWKVHWGLGFVVSQSEGTTYVSHGGSCPGYRTTLQLDPKNKMAYTVMINAGGESPERLAREIRQILSKAAKEGNDKKPDVNLNDFSGHYSAQPWGSEVLILPWYGKLVEIGLPSEDPSDGMTMLQHVSGDTFKRIRDDKTLGEEIRFERDKSGKVIRAWQHSNYSTKID